MDKWNKYNFEEISDSSLIGLVRNSNEQSLNNEFDYLKMNNITNDGNLDLSQIVKVKATKEEVEKYKLEKGDFLFNTRNSIELVGKTAVYNYDELILFNNNILRVRFKKHIDSKFINYQFKSTIFKEKLEKIKSGTTNVAAIYYKSLKNIEVYAPRIEEQRRIVKKLDQLFEKIDNSILLLEENLIHSQSLMGSFLDGIFDRISKKYPATPLLKFVDFVGGSQPPKSSFSNIKKDGYVRLIQIRDYKSDNNIVYIKENSTKKFCDESDVMIGRYGPPVFQILKGLNGAYNVALMKAVPNENVICKDFLYYFLMNGKIQSYIISISQRSAGQSGVNKKALESYEISIPPLEEQKIIVDRIKSAIPKINGIQNLMNNNLNLLKALKSSLLDQAFKGEL